MLNKFHVVALLVRAYSSNLSRSRNGTTFLAWIVNLQMSDLAETMQQDGPKHHFHIANSEKISISWSLFQVPFARLLFPNLRSGPRYPWVDQPRFLSVYPRTRPPTIAPLNTKTFAYPPKPRVFLRAVRRL